jgi:hypothetical protein
MFNKPTFGLLELFSDKADGSSLDWVYQEAGISLAYIVELKPTR